MVNLTETLFRRSFVYFPRARRQRALFFRVRMKHASTKLLNWRSEAESSPLECSMQEARIELLQRMPVFGGIRADILQFLLDLCPIVSVPTNEFFFRERDQADSMFVLEAGKAWVPEAWRGHDFYLLRTLKEGDCFGEMAVIDILSPQRFGSCD